MKFSQVNQKAEQTAASIISAIGKDEPSLADLIAWLTENFGIKFEISKMDLSNHPVCGLVFQNPATRAHKVVVDRNDSAERQRFSVCHELAHILREKELVFGFFNGDLQNQDYEERFCNRFAAAYLMPEKSFRAKWASTSENFLIKRYAIAEYFGVSKETVMYRALELGLQ